MLNTIWQNIHLPKLGAVRVGYVHCGVDFAFGMGCQTLHLDIQGWILDVTHFMWISKEGFWMSHTLSGLWLSHTSSGYPQMDSGCCTLHLDTQGWILDVIHFIWISTDGLWMSLVYGMGTPGWPGFWVGSVPNLHTQHLLGKPDNFKALATNGSVYIASIIFNNIACGIDLHKRKYIYVIQDQDQTSTLNQHELPETESQHQHQSGLQKE